MEGIYALHFLFKPNYFGNFAQNIIGKKQILDYQEIITNCTINMIMV